MVRLTDAQIAQYKHDGFVIIPNFLSQAEVRAAQEGFFRFFAPSHHDHDATRRTGRAFNARDGGILIFPWPSVGLNEIMVHPDLIDACERIIGTKRVRMCEAHLGMKYAAKYEDGTTSGTPPSYFHQDFGNNTLGPHRKPIDDDFRHVAGFYCLDDVGPGMAPIQMLSNQAAADDTDSAVKMIVPAGSLCLYSIYTRHAASDWDVERVPRGHRPTAWVSYCSAEPNRLWDGGRYFSIKASQIYMGHFGPGLPKGSSPRHRGPALSYDLCMTHMSPRQLNVAFMIPLPGDELWTEAFISRWCTRWKAFDRGPYDKARKQLEMEKTASPLLSLSKPELVERLLRLQLQARL